MFRYFDLEDFNLKGKLVGVRVDFNSPIINGKIEFNDRIKAHLKTIKKLQEKECKIVILAHQGRKGKKDFISLKEHYNLLKDKLENLKFINELYSKKVKEKIKNLKPKEVLLLENLRFLDDELNVNKKDNVIKELINSFDYYVLDAFSVSHREQTSIVGATRIPVLAGLVMDNELKNLNKIEDLNERPFVYLFGGAKPDDLILLIERGLKNEKVDLVITSGVIGELFLKAKGYYLGIKEKFLEEKGYLINFDKIKNLYKQFYNKILTPKDVALYNEKTKKREEINVEDLKFNKEILNKYLIQDIGEKTINYYSKFLKNSSIVYYKGPQGNFENKNFEKGTKEILKTLETINAFKFLGGGHSLTAIEKYSNKKYFNYISLAGGALVHFIAGKELPGINTLVRSYNKFEKENPDFLVVGSNVVDTRINVGSEYKNVHLGDKIKIKDNFETSIGGGGINVSTCLTRLGAKVLYLSKFSEESKDLVFKDLKRNNIKYVDTKISKIPSAKSIILDFKEDRVIYSFRGQNPFLEIKDFDIEKINCKYAYFSSLGEKSFQTLISLASKLKKKGVKIAFNPSLYLIKTEKVVNILKLLDVLILNFEEAKELSKQETVDNCLKELNKLVKLVVITDGDHGAYAYEKEENNKSIYNKIYFEKARKVNVVDSTGAGDSFGSTFFYFYVNNFGIKKSLQLASINSSKVVSTKGSKNGLLYYDDLINIIKNEK